jgi:lipoprotein signal peptidase
MSQVGLAVVVVDLGTKAWAQSQLGTEPVWILPWLHLQLVHNLGGAFGWSAGAYTWQLNLALTLCAVVFVFPVARDLSRVDRSAPRALGLILGGALGNLASLVAPPAGVLDFLAVQWQPGHSVVLNVADLAAYLGLALITRTGLRIAGAIRKEAKAASVARVARVYAQTLARAGAGASAQVARGRASHLQADEIVVRDWSQVVDLGVVRGDASQGDETGMTRPMGATVAKAVKLVPNRPVAEHEVQTAPIRER